VTAIREQVASAVGLIVQQTRFACSSRRIAHHRSHWCRDWKIQLQDLFEYVFGFTYSYKTDGYYTGCDAVPQVLR
jgi:pilus assembly protein CpaF